MSWWVGTEDGLAAGPLATRAAALSWALGRFGPMQGRTTIEPGSYDYLMGHRGGDVAHQVYICRGDTELGARLAALDE